MKLSILGFYLRHEVRTGGHKRYLELLDALATKGWDVSVIISDTIDTSHYHFQCLKVKPVYRGKIIPYSIKQLFRILPKIISLPKKSWITIAFGETNYISLNAAKLLKRSKVMFAFRSNSYKAKDDEYRYYGNKITLKKKLFLKKMLHLEKSIIKLSDILVFQTTIDRDDIMTRTAGDLTKAVIIPNSLNESWFDKDFKYTNSSTSLKKIIYLGNYDTRKGALFLLKAFNLLKDKDLDLELHLYGGGNERIGLLEYAKKKEITNKVHIHGKLENPISSLGGYDLMIIPSVYDSYPNVILEALFTGTPVIGSDNSGMKSILEYDELLFKTGNPQDIAEKIEALYNNNELYQSVYKLCRERAEFHDFSWPGEFEKVLINE